MKLQTLTINSSTSFLVSVFLLISASSCKKTNDITQTPKQVNALSASDIIAAPNLVAWYKFTNGNTADFSGNNNHLTPYNVTPTTDRNGKPNNAFYFSGNGSFMKAANTSTLNPSTITIAVLCKPQGFYTGTGQLSRILMKGDDDQTNGVYYMSYNVNKQFDGNYGDNQFNNSYVQSSANTLVLDNWYKLVYTYDGTVSKLYVNDTLVSSSRKTASFTPNTDPLRVGKTGRPDYPYWFIGVIDEIRIYNTALARPQLTQIANQLGKE